MMPVFSFFAVYVNVDYSVNQLFHSFVSISRTINRQEHFLSAAHWDRDGIIKGDRHMSSVNCIIIHVIGPDADHLLCVVYDHQFVSRYDLPRQASMQ